MHIEWSDDPETNEPVATIHTDLPFDGNSLRGITGVRMAWGSQPCTVTFFDRRTEDLAMREIVERIKGANASIGWGTDSRTGVSW